MLEIIEALAPVRPRPRAILFDFDGTLSTLRSGWEEVMAELMEDSLLPLVEPEKRPALAGQIADYIAESTGIQTIFQMQWLADQVAGLGQSPLDPWDYKAEYNTRLMAKVGLRRAAVQSGQALAADYLIGGSQEFLTELTRQGLDLYVASGTDEADVKQEAKILGLAHYFAALAGAPPGVASCSKELVLERLVKESGHQGQEIVVIGDGKVEIELARRAGSLALGLATHDTGQAGVNQAKRQRLIKAGAHALASDFKNKTELLTWLLLDN